ncbi:MAG: hypothetical protein AAGC68_03730 [Verrucomicrobiota bacterium]
MSTLEAAFGQLPTPILEKLDSMIARVRRIMLIRGLFATLAVGLACLLTIMVIDATFTLFTSSARWALSLFGSAITIVAAWWYLMRPLSRKLTLTHMARILEVRHPELQERISTAVELLSSDDPESIKGSEELIAAVVDSAIDDVDTVDPKTEFQPARTKKFGLVALSLVGVIALALLIWPKQSWTLLTRAVAPFLDIGNAYADSLVIDPGDTKVAKGSPVTIEVSVQHKRLKRAEVRRVLADGSESVERMTLIGEEDDGTKRFSLTFPRVEDDFEYRVRAGAALSRFFQVDSVAPPVVESITIAYDYPEYTGLAPVTEASETGEIRAVAHTRVRVEATSNKALYSSRLFLNEDTDMGAPSIEGQAQSWEFVLRPGMTGSWNLELSDENGFTNDPISYPIEVLPDKAPTVQITQPQLRELRLRPTEVLQLGAEVIEDFGVAESSLLMIPTREGVSQEISQPLPSPGSVEGRFLAKASLDLSSLDLRQIGDRFSIVLQVKDNRPGDYDGPGIGSSEPIFITIDRNAKSLADQAIEAQKKAVEERLREAKRELEKARDDLRRTEQHLNRDKDSVSEAARRELDEFSERTEIARENLDEVASLLDQSLFQEQADTARRIADESIADAREKAAMIPLQDDRQERLDETRSAREDTEKAIREVDELARKMRDAEDDYRAISQLNDLANRQQELAMEAREWAEKEEQFEAANQRAQQKFDQEQRQQMNEFQQKQNQVQQQLGQMLKDNAAALEEILGAQQKETEQLAAAAEALSQEQDRLKDMSEEATRADSEQLENLRENLLNKVREEQEALAAEASTRAEELASSRENSMKSSPEEESSDSSNPEGFSDRGETEPAPPTAEAREAAALADAAQEAGETAEQLAKEQLETAAETAAEASSSFAEASQASAENGTGSDSPSNPSPSESGTTESGTPESAEMAQNQSSEDAAASADEATNSEGAPTSPDTDSSGDPSAPSNATASSEQLAKRQEALTSQIEALAAGDIQEALAMMEAELDDDAKSLENQAEAVEQAMQNLQQNQAKANADRAEQALSRGSQNAQSAEKQLSQAQQQQDQAESRGDSDPSELAQMASRAMQQSQGQQAQAANQWRQAAQALSQASESMGRTMEGLEPSDMDDRLADSKDLAEGFQETTESAQSENSQEAAQQSEEAAQALQQVAQSAMEKLGQAGNPSMENQPGMPQMPTDQLSGDPNSENLNEHGLKTGDLPGNGVPPELQALGISMEDWERFQGTLVGGNATAIETELPTEYRELIGRYFQVIAKEAAKE